MKKISTLLVLVLAALSVVSCKFSIVDRVNDFVNEVEANYSTYSDVDWQVATQKYDEFKVEFAKKYDRLSQAERDLINQAFGRYDAVVAKDKVEDVVNGLKNTVKDAGEWLKGVVDGVAGSGQVQESQEPQGDTIQQ